MRTITCRLRLSGGSDEGIETEKESCFGAHCLAPLAWMGGLYLETSTGERERERGRDIKHVHLQLLFVVELVHTTINGSKVKYQLYNSPNFNYLSYYDYKI